MRIRKKINRLLFLITFLFVPMGLYAETKELICVRTIPAEDNEFEWAQKLRKDCEDNGFVEKYKIKVDTSLIEQNINQSMDVELEYQACQFPRPYDNGVKKMKIKTNELVVFHFGKKEVFINRNDLSWKTAMGSFESYSRDNLQCEIKDIDTSKRKL